MPLLDEPTVRGSADLYGVFADPQGRVMALASAFPLLTAPPARAAYAGQTLRYRLAIHPSGAAAPLAVFDDMGLPITDVAFHPTLPVVAIGAGRYDGGFEFEGDLVLWNWVTGERQRPFAQVPEVILARFDAAGDRLEVFTRPWNEEWDGQKLGDDVAFKAVYRLETPLPAVTSATNMPDIGKRLTKPPARAKPPPAAETLARWLGAPVSRKRGAVWAVRWLADGRLGVAHDGARLEIFDTTGALSQAFPGEGYGAEILATDPPCVHVVKRRHGLRGEWGSTSQLMAVEGGTLVQIVAFDAAMTFSSSRDGRVLARRDRSPDLQPGGGDALIEPAARQVTLLDLGHYDVFNHYIGIEGAPNLFLVQGTPPSAYDHKVLATVGPDGAVTRLWPLLPDDGTPASHPMECAGAYVEDAAGPAVVIGGHHYEPNPGRPPRCFLYRKPLDRDVEAWRLQTTAAPAAIAHAPEAGLIVASLLDGRLTLARAADGTVLLDGKAHIGGLATIVFSLDVHGDRLALGTADGRIAVLSIAALLRAGAPDGAVSLG